MKDLILVFSEEFIAVLIGISVYRYLTRPFRIIVFQVIIAFVVELICYYLRTQRISNNWLYNFYLMVDCSLLVLAAFYLLLKQSGLILLMIGYVLFIAVWLYDICMGGIGLFSKHAYQVSSILLFGTYFIVLYFEPLSFPKPIFRMPVFWLSLSTIIFYGVNITNFSLVDILVASHSVTTSQQEIISLIIDSFVAIRYLMVAYAFLLFYTNGKAPQMKILKYASK